MKRFPRHIDNNVLPLPTRSADRERNRLSGRGTLSSWRLPGIRNSDNCLAKPKSVEIKYFVGGNRPCIASSYSDNQAVNRHDPFQANHESALLPLLAAVQNGSVDTQNQLMGQLRSYFQLLADAEPGKHLQQKIGNSDVVQQSCIRVIEGIDGFRGTTEGELRNWLRQVLVNEVRQAQREFRTQKRDVRRELPLDAESRHAVPGIQPVDSLLTPCADALAREQAAAVRSAVARLSDEYQQVIRMRSWQGMTFPQIAEQLGKTVNATEKLWYRAVQRLRRELANYNDTCE